MRTWLPPLLLLCATLSAPARAAEPSAHLLPCAHCDRDAGRPSFRSQFAAGAAAAMVAVPLSLGFAIGFGAVPTDLLVALIPAALVLVIVPALAVTWAVRAMGNRDHPGTYRWAPAVWLTLGVQLLAVAGGMLFGLAVANFTSFFLVTLAEMVLLPAAATLPMRWQAARPVAVSGPAAAAAFSPAMSFSF
jgi:hypothetical protein